jgi:hypothetical protein
LLACIRFAKLAIMSAVKAAERYSIFSDNTMQDRLAAHAASLARDKPKSKKDDPLAALGINLGRELEPSGKCEGWDKYYFFSVPGYKVSSGDAAKDAKGKDAKPVADPPLKLPTANLGRRRPAAHGPQSFNMETFSKERIQRERQRIEKKGGGGGRSEFAESYGQLPRAPSASLGLPTYEGQRFATTASNAISPGTLNRAASDTVLQKGPPAMTHAAGTMERQRMGPYWPPKTEKRPDSLSTREGLFPGGHRTFVDLHSVDRPAARGVGYIVHVG